MWRIRWTRCVPLWFCALAVMAEPAHAEAVFSSAAINWECGDYGSRSQWDDMCMAWRKRMGDLGYTKKRANYSKMVLFRFTDPTLPGATPADQWGEDNDYIDSAIAGLICTHGMTPHDEAGKDAWRGLMYRETHDDGCTLRKKHRLYGRQSGGRLRFLQLSSCNSIPWQFRRSWNAAAAGGVHVIAGFHGTSHIGESFVDDYRHVADDGHSAGVASAWVTDMYHVMWWPERADPQCPVARSYGDSEDEALDRLHERYDDNLDDVAPTFVQNLFISGCNPRHGTKLPD